MFKMGKVQTKKKKRPKNKQGTPNPLNNEWTRNAQILERWKEAIKENVQNGSSEVKRYDEPKKNQSTRYSLNIE